MMIERYHIEERNDITQHKEEKRNTNRGGDPNKPLIYFLFCVFLFSICYHYLVFRFFRKRPQKYCVKTSYKKITCHEINKAYSRKSYSM